MYREKDEPSLGFCVRGGSEHGLGIYVSEIEDDSAAGNMFIYLCALNKRLRKFKICRRDTRFNDVFFYKLCVRSHLLSTSAKCYWSFNTSSFKALVSCVF